MIHLKRMAMGAALGAALIGVVVVVAWVFTFYPFMAAAAAILAIAYAVGLWVLE